LRKQKVTDKIPFGSLRLEFTVTTPPADADYQREFYIQEQIMLRKLKFKIWFWFNAWKLRRAEKAYKKQQEKYFEELPY